MKGKKKTSPKECLFTTIQLLLHMINMFSKSNYYLSVAKYLCKKTPWPAKSKGKRNSAILW